MKVFLLIWISAVLIQEVIPGTLVRLPRHTSKPASVHTEYEAKYEQTGQHGNETSGQFSGKQEIVHDNCADNWNSFADKCASLIKDLVASLANTVSSRPGDATKLQLQIKNTFRHFDSTQNCNCLDGKNFAKLDFSPLLCNLTVTTTAPTGDSDNGSSAGANNKHETDCNENGESHGGGNHSGLKVGHGSNGGGGGGGGSSDHSDNFGTSEGHLLGGFKKPKTVLNHADNPGFSPENDDCSDTNSNSRRETGYSQVFWQPENKTGISHSANQGSQISISRSPSPFLVTPEPSSFPGSPTAADENNSHHGHSGGNSLGSGRHHAHASSVIVPVDSGARLTGPALPGTLTTYSESDSHSKSSVGISTTDSHNSAHPAVGGKSGGFGDHQDASLVPVILTPDAHNLKNGYSNSKASVTVDSYHSESKTRDGSSDSHQSIVPNGSNFPINNSPDQGSSSNKAHVLLSLSKNETPENSHSGHSGSHSGHSGSHSGHSGSHSGHSESHSGHSGSHSGHSGSHSGHSGSDLGPPESHLGHSGSDLGPPESHLGHSGSDLGPPESHLGHSESHSGHSGSHLGHSGSHLGPPESHLGHSETHSGHSESHSGHSGSHLGPPVYHKSSPVAELIHQTTSPSQKDSWSDRKSEKHGGPKDNFNDFKSSNSGVSKINYDSNIPESRGTTNPLPTIPGPNSPSAHVTQAHVTPIIPEGVPKSIIDDSKRHTIYQSTVTETGGIAATNDDQNGCDESHHVTAVPISHGAQDGDCSSENKGSGGSTSSDTSHGEITPVAAHPVVPLPIVPVLPAQPLPESGNHQTTVDDCDESHHEATVSSHHTVKGDIGTDHHGGSKKSESETDTENCNDEKTPVAVHPVVAVPVVPAVAIQPLPESGSLQSSTQDDHTDCDESNYEATIPTSHHTDQEGDCINEDNGEKSTETRNDETIPVTVHPVVAVPVVPAVALKPLPESANHQAEADHNDCDESHHEATVSVSDHTGQDGDCSADDTGENKGSGGGTSHGEITPVAAQPVAVVPVVPAVAVQPLPEGGSHHSTTHNDHNDCDESHHEATVSNSDHTGQDGDCSGDNTDENRVSGVGTNSHTSKDEATHTVVAVPVVPAVAVQPLPESGSHQTSTHDDHSDCDESHQGATVPISHHTGTDHQDENKGSVGGTISDTSHDENSPVTTHPVVGIPIVPLVPIQPLPESGSHQSSAHDDQNGFDESHGVGANGVSHQSSQDGGNDGCDGKTENTVATTPVAMHPVAPVPIVPGVAVEPLEVNEAGSGSGHEGNHESTVHNVTPLPYPYVPGGQTPINAVGEGHSDHTGNEESALYKPTTFQTTESDPTPPQSILIPTESTITLTHNSEGPQPTEGNLTGGHSVSSHAKESHEDDDDDEDDEDCCECESFADYDIKDPQKYKENACKNLEEARRELKAIFDKIKKKLKCGKCFQSQSANSAKSH